MMMLARASVGWSGLLTAAIALAACAGEGAQAQHVSAGCTGQRRVALTFDDGPNPPYTQQIVDVLSSHGARATFFATGAPAEAHPEVLRRVAAAGMEVGSHSYAHEGDLARTQQDGIAADLERAERALVGALGGRPQLYRAPHGRTSAPMLRALHARNYLSVGWDVDSRDWSGASADEIADNVLSQLRPGAIVLMHDGGLGGGNPDRAATLAALPRILDGLRAQGYDAVTVSELLGLRGGDGAPEVAACSVS